MISIIIPNLHSPLIGDVVAALQRQTAREHICEIIVVGQDRYGKVPATVQAITTPAPVSAAAARNIGARQSLGEYLLFLDADCIAAPDLVERLVARHAQGYLVVGGAMRLEANSYWVLCDNLLSFSDALVTAQAGARPYLASFCLCVQRSVFEVANGFDESYPGAAGEDIDLSLRLRQQGWELYFDPTVQVAHRPARSSAWAMWQHQRGFGQAYYRVARQMPALLPSPIQRLRPSMSYFLRVAAPLLAAVDVVRQVRTIVVLHARAAIFLGMWLGRIGWYVGVAQACGESTRHQNLRQPQSGSS